MAYNEIQTAPSYDGVARALHWLTAILIVAQFIIGWVMPDINHDTKVEGAVWWHMLVGGALLLTIFIRVVWRLSHTPPPDNLTPWLRLTSRSTHFLLYAALIATPLLGWANASSRGWVVRIANLIPLPALTATGSTLGHAMGDVHGIMAWVLLGLIILHICAALFHHFVLKDNVMKRMM